MMPVPLQPIPNQEFQFVADGQQYDLTIRSNDDVMFMDVTVNGVDVMTQCLCLVNQMVLPYPYLEGLGGNFIFTTASGENPQYQNFGGPDVLLYATNAEMAQARALNAAALLAINLGPGQAP
jgi:hypothetical protein